jgi:hypothetical protein
MHGQCVMTKNKQDRQPGQGCCSCLALLPVPSNGNYQCFLKEIGLFGDGPQGGVLIY